MKKGYRFGTYWFITLASSYLLLSVLTSALLDHNTLMKVFQYNRHLESAQDLAKSVLVLGLRPCTIIAGLVCAVMYNYRSGHVLLLLEGKIRYCNENVWACLLCSITGGVTSSYYLLNFSTLGFVMLLFGACTAWVIIPLVAIFYGVDRADRKVEEALRGAALYYPRVNRIRKHTLSGAFRGLFDWNSRAVRFVVSFIFFTSIAMMMNVLLGGPLKGIIQAAGDYALAEDRPFWGAVVDFVRISAPYLPMINGIFCAVFFENSFARVMRRVHPAAMLLTFGPLMAIVTYVMLIGLMLAGVYSVMWLLLVGVLIRLDCIGVPQIEEKLFARMMKRRKVPYEESLNLKLVLICGFALPIILFVLGG